MNNVVVERDTLFIDIASVLIILVLVINAYIFGEIKIIFIGIVFPVFFYFISRSVPLEYFWANEEGIMFYIGKYKVTEIPWYKINRVIFESVIEGDENKKDRVEIQLNEKLKKQPRYIRSSGLFKTRLFLYEGKKTRRIFEELTNLKENYENECNPPMINGS